MLPRLKGMDAKRRESGRRLPFFIAFFQSKHMNDTEINFQKLLSYKQFRLGHLTTEQSHYLTKSLSDLCDSNLSLALKRLKEVDLLALSKISDQSHRLKSLSCSIKKTLDSGHKIFLCGCGATGRLALTLETLFRKSFPANSNQIVSFMAGGDYALIKSVESFEDNAEFGARQLAELGFKNGDLLISSSEGGETNFVIGATIAASKKSTNKPYFLFCNPKRELRNITRSANIFSNKSIRSYSLPVGPMALSGSTRMQATTCLLMFIGIPLLNFNLPELEVEKLFKDYVIQLKKINYQKLSRLITKEYQCYQDEEIINYIANADHAISILTDTTERSPTFSLNAFESKNERHRSFAYLVVADTKNSRQAWNYMLGREPRGLNWTGLKTSLELNNIYDFDISEQSKVRREKFKARSFHITSDKKRLGFKLDSVFVPFSVFIQEPLFEHLMIKLLLNAHSTLLMGKMGRYYSNVMTWVKPSNLKLIDRSIRYIDLLLREQGKVVSYEDILKRIIDLKAATNENDPIVLKVFNSFIDNPY